MQVYLDIPIEPIAKARPRFKLINGKPIAYTPSKTKSYENLIFMEYIKRYTRQAKFPAGTPIGILLEFGLPIPKSTPKKRRALMADGQLMPAKKPDVDNLTKAVLDALNGLAYHDDSQICKLIAIKRYSEKPYVRISIDEICTDLAPADDDDR